MTRIAAYRFENSVALDPPQGDGAQEVTLILADGVRVWSGDGGAILYKGGDLERNGLQLRAALRLGWARLAS